MQAMAMKWMCGIWVGLGRGGPWSQQRLIRHQLAAERSVESYGLFDVASFDELDRSNSQTLYRTFTSA